MIFLMDSPYLRTMTLFIPVCILEYIYVGNTAYLPATLILSLLWMHKALNPKEYQPSLVTVREKSSTNRNTLYA